MSKDIGIGDKVRVSIEHRWVIGIVTRAAWWNSRWDISYDLVERSGTPASGPGRWKQETDGGTVEVLERAEAVQ